MPKGIVAPANATVREGSAVAVQSEPLRTNESVDIASQFTFRETFSPSGRYRRNLMAGWGLLKMKLPASSRPLNLSLVSLQWWCPPEHGDDPRLVPPIPQRHTKVQVAETRHQQPRPRKVAHVSANAVVETAVVASSLVLRVFSSSPTWGERNDSRESMFKIRLFGECKLEWRKWILLRQSEMENLAGNAHSGRQNKKVAPLWKMRLQARCTVVSSRSILPQSCLRLRASPWRTQRTSIRRHSTSASRDDPPLSHFMQSSPKTSTTTSDPAPYLPVSTHQTYYIEPYGCQMNFNDSDIINAILQSHNFRPSTVPSDADIILLVTCAIRDNAEEKIWRRLSSLQPLRERGGKVAVLGCMAERLKFKLLEGDRLVDVVCGPDAYRDLPGLLANGEDGGVGNVMLSADETYADILPVQIEEGRVSACITIMRGCNNMCTYCIVPFTRGIIPNFEVDSRKGKISTGREYIEGSATFGSAGDKTDYITGTKRQFLPRSLGNSSNTTQFPLIS